VITHDELMRYMDGELPPERAREVEAALATDTELRREHAIFQRMKSDLGAMGRDMKTPTDGWDAVSRRLARPMGWILCLVGLVVWLGYALYMFITGPEALWEKLAVGAVLIGLGMLFLSVVIDRLRDLKTDPYREIQR
jgi:ferric-dicitrate binding protein FerR (iron transport regulator)